MQWKNSFLGFSLFALASAACSSNSPATSDDAGNVTVNDAATSGDGSSSLDAATDSSSVTPADSGGDSSTTPGDAQTDATPDAENTSDSGDAATD